MQIRILSSIVTSACLVLLGAGAARALTVVDTCGQVVTGGGVLDGDLDCTGFPGDAIVVNAGNKLDFAGHTLTGGNGPYGFIAARDDGGVRFKDCDATNNGLDGLYFDRGFGFSMKVVGGTFSDNGRDGIRFDDERFIGEMKVRIVKSEMSRNGANGVFAGPDEPLDTLRLIKTVSNDNTDAGIATAAFVEGVIARSVESTGNGTYGLINVGRSFNPNGPC